MAEVAPLDATFFAFRKRDRRFVLTLASSAYLGFALLLGAAYLAATWGAWGAIFTWYIDLVRSAASGGEPNMPPMGPLLALAPCMVLAVVAGYVLFAAYEAACLRWLLRGESGGGVFGLSLGADTWRVFACYCVWVGLLIGFVVLVAGFYLGVRALAEIAGPLQIVLMLGAALAPLGLLALLLFVAVRLAPGAAMSVARGRFAFFGAWHATRGRFWALLGGFFILIVGYVVIGGVMSEVLQIPVRGELAPIMASILAGGDADAALASLREAFMTPMFFALGAVYLAAAMILASVFRVALFGLNARAVLAAESS
jgi:hypothetical protein